MPSAKLTRREVNIVIAGCITAMSLSSIDSTAVNTALLRMVTELGGISAYTWVGTAYLLTSTAAMMVFGKLSDLFGRRLLFQIALLVFIVGSIGSATAQTMTWLVGARALQGIGGGGLQALTFTIIADLVAPRERARYGGITTAVFAVMSVIGPLFGGFVTQHLTWRWIFWVNLPLGAVAFTVVGRTLRLPFNRGDKKVDYVGSTLVVTSVVLIVLAMTWMPDEFGWKSAATITTAVTGVALGAFFVWYERKPAEPVVPLHLFRNPVVVQSLLLNSVAGCTLVVVSAFLPLFLQAVTGYSPTKAGLLMVPNIIAISAAANISGRSIARTGRYRWWPIAGSIFVTTAMVMFTGVERSGVAFVMIWPALVVLGLGIGTSMPPATVTLQNAVETWEMGIATSLMQFTRSLLSTLSLAGFGAILNSRLAKIDPKYLRSPKEIAALPPAQRNDVLDTLANAITYVFRYTIPLGVVVFVLAIVAKELPLRTESAHGFEVEAIA